MLFGDVLHGEMQLNEAGRMVIARMGENTGTVSQCGIGRVHTHYHGSVIQGVKNNTDDRRFRGE